MKTIEEYQEELFDKIPITQSLGAKILELNGDHARLHFPLRENINYEGTAFGGSLNTACILACYIMTHHWLKLQDIKFNSLVIQRSEIQYLAPTHTDFETLCLMSGETQKNQFLKLLNRRKIARLELKSQVLTSKSKEPHVKFKGSFVVQL